MNKKKINFGGLFRKRSIFFLLITCTVVVSAIWLFKPQKTKNEIKQEFEKEEEIANKEEKQTLSDTIDVTFSTEYSIDSDKQSIQLINPKNNTVNMQFTVFIDGKEIEKTKLVKPDSAKTLNLKRILNIGNYKMDVKVRTFDIKTGKECSSIPVYAIKVNVS